MHTTQRSCAKSDDRGLNEANRYPRHFTAALREEIARREGLTADHVFLTAGSTELLGLAGLTYGLEKGELVACNPTFDFLMLYAERLGCSWARTPLTPTYQYDSRTDKALIKYPTHFCFYPIIQQALKYQMESCVPFVKRKPKNIQCMWMKRMLN